VQVERRNQSLSKINPTFFLGTLSVSWYPPGMADDEGQPWDDLMPLLLDTAEKYKLKVNDSNAIIRIFFSLGQFSY